MSGGSCAAGEESFCDAEEVEERIVKPCAAQAHQEAWQLGLGGLAAREGRPIRTLHLAQLLRDALKGGEAKP